MSNAPFKIAFWVMSLAFGLTVLLTGLKPEEIRSALNPDLQIEEQGSPEFESSVAKLDSVSPDHSRSQSSYSQRNNTAPQTEPRPIRVASADLDGSLGLTDESPSSEPERFAFTPEATQSATVQLPHEEEIQILVPDPVESLNYYPRESVGNDVVHLKKKVLRLQLAHAHRELEDIRRKTEQQEVERVERELKLLKKQIGDLKEQQNAVQGTAMTPASSEIKIPEQPTLEPMPEPMHVAFAEPERVTELESRIEVTAGTKEKTFSFRFENANIHDVLKTLAERADWNIVIHSEVEGTFSGNFENAAPKQAFASVIKLHSFGVSFRGDHVLVRGQKDARVR